MNILLNVTRRVVIDVLDADNNPVVALVQANFASIVTVNGVRRATLVTITEVDAVNAPGQYRVVFTPDLVGAWVVLVRHAIYEPGGFRMDYDVVADLTPDDGSGVPARPKITGHVATSSEVAVSFVGNLGYTYRVSLLSPVSATEDTEDVAGGVKTVRLVPVSSGLKTIRVVGVDGDGNALTPSASLAIVVPTLRGV